MCLTHSCDEGPKKKAKRFALSASEIAKLPTLQESFDSTLHVNSKDVETAIVKDLPITQGELEQMRSGRGSSFHNAIQKARKV